MFNFHCMDNYTHATLQMYKNNKVEPFFWKKSSKQEFLNRNIEIVWMTVGNEMVTFDKGKLCIR